MAFQFSTETVDILVGEAEGDAPNPRQTASFRWIAQNAGTSQAIDFK
jgi:hypothetical protein